MAPPMNDDLRIALMVTVEYEDARMNGLSHDEALGIAEMESQERFRKGHPRTWVPNAATTGRPWPWV